MVLEAERSSGRGHDTGWEIDESATVRLVAALFAAATFALTLGSAQASREIPIGIFNVNDAQGHDATKENRLYAIRFVLDKPATIYRFFSGFNLEGVYTDGKGAAAPEDIRTKCRTSAPKSPALGKNSTRNTKRRRASLPGGWSKGNGRGIGYAHGNGGELWARLVPMKEDGTPDLASPLAEEKFNPVDRYNAIKRPLQNHRQVGNAFRRTGWRLALSRHALLHRLFEHAGKPEFDYVSFNSPVTNASVAGQNGTNTLDPDATGAIAGLDPREAVPGRRTGA